MQGGGHNHKWGRFGLMAEVVRYGIDELHMKQSEIARELCLSRERIRQIVGKMERIERRKHREAQNGCLLGIF